MEQHAKENISVKLELPISGMSCASCVAKIEKSLSVIPGVEEVKVNFTTESSVILYDSSQVRPAVLAVGSHKEQAH